MGRMRSTPGGAADRSRLPVRTALIALCWLLALPVAAAAQEPAVLATRVDAKITPVTADHLAEGLRTAEREDYAAYLVELDTPGGLLASTREIVQEILASPVPVLVYVAPSGARAASAGAYITLSAHIAAMAPGTNVGAGTPVTGQGDPADRKAVNDAAAFAVSLAGIRGRNTAFAGEMVREGTSVPAGQAARTGVVDLLAASRAELLAEADGRRVDTRPQQSGGGVVLDLSGARVVEHELGFTGELRQVLASPELAFLFLALGTLALIFELAAPGFGVAGVSGVVLLVLGFTALSVLPFDTAGLLLLLLAAALLVTEVLTPGTGVFAAGGAVALLLAGIFLFRGQDGADPVHPAVLWPVALVAGAGALLAGRLAWRARRAPPAAGGGLLTGRTAVVAAVEREEDDAGRGQVWLEGAWWTVRGRGAPLAAGQRVRVVDQEGLELVVEPEGPGEDTGDDRTGDGPGEHPGEDGGISS